MSDEARAEALRTRILLCVLASLLTMLLAVGLMLTIPDTGQSMQHPMFDGMRHSTSSWERLMPIRWHVLFFIFGMFGLFFSLVALGLIELLKERGSLLWFVLICVIVFSGFVAMVVSHWSYAMASDETLRLWLGLPEPTFLMLTCVWGCPLLFTIFFALKFRKDVWGERQRAEFDALLAERAKRQPVAEGEA